jgi:hypothetical protein
MLKKLLWYCTPDCLIQVAILHPSLVFSSHIQNLPLFSPHLLLLLVSASRKHTPQKNLKTHKETMGLQFLVFV